MESINLDDMKQIEMGHSTDWLDMEEAALIYSTIVFPVRTNHAKQSPPINHNNDSDLTPFNPNYQSTEPQTIISNLPQLKECEFYHTYILHHLEQLEIDPPLCSKCPI